MPRTITKSFDRTKILAELAALHQNAKRLETMVNRMSDPATPVAMRRGRPEDPVLAALRAKIKDLISERAYTLAEIVKLTGETSQRCSAAIVKLQKQGVRVVNLGNRRLALWFAPSDEILARFRGTAEKG